MNAADWTKHREQFELVLAFLASWWREALIVGVLAFGAIGWHKHNADERALGALQFQLHAADSVAKIVKPVVVHYDTVVQRDTRIVYRSVARVDSIRDTVLAHITDTLVVKQYVAATDSMRHACTELANDCETFRANATKLIGAQNTEITALKKIKAPHPCGLTWSLGPAVARTTDGWRLAPFAATAGIGCRF